jgi:hypothetical protein
MLSNSIQMLSNSPINLESPNFLFKLIYNPGSVMNLRSISSIYDCNRQTHRFPHPITILRPKTIKFCSKIFQTFRSPSPSSVLKKHQKTFSTETSIFTISFRISDFYCCESKGSVQAENVLHFVLINRFIG